MKKFLAIILALLMLTGCSGNTVAEATDTETATAAEAADIRFAGTMVPDRSSAPEYSSRFDSETRITLSDEEILVEGSETAVSITNDIVYYEDRDTYASGNPYGEGSEAEMHTAEAAAAHTVVNITEPGAYRVSGKLSAGQIRVDLGDDAYFDSKAVVELILEDADITCTVAPAVLFLNTYECDGNWSADAAQAEVDTSAAGANLILEGKNTVSGSYVARIFKDAEGEKKLWKQDGAIYSYMSLNVYGPGALDLTAENEGLDSELHLTINGGDIAIRSGNDGINTNEDGVSVTTINGGSLHIIAGLGEEGDGIDSNGYLVINGGTVVAAANPAADAGLDSDMGSYVNGGVVVAMGSTMDWAESNSAQVTMNLQFAEYQSSGSAIVVTQEDGTVVFAYDPSEDEILGEDVRRYMGAVISCPGFTQGDTYSVYMDGTLTGEEVGGIYTSVTDYMGGTQMQYTGTDVAMMGGGMGGRGGMGQMGEMPEGGRSDNTRDNNDENMPEMPDDFDPSQIEGEFTMPEGAEIPEGGFGGGRGGIRGEMSEEDRESMTPPDGFGRQRPEDSTMPEDFDGEIPEGGMMGGNRGQGGTSAANSEASTSFYMSDKVNAFSGVCAVAA